MINVERAEKTIDETTFLMESETVFIEKSFGRVLSKPIYATRDQPPFNRVAMDGIAINTNCRDLNRSIEGIQAAGEAQMVLKNANNCLEVMTGASLPLNTNCVIPYENIKTNENRVTIFAEDIQEMKNIHPLGKDYTSGDELLPIGTRVTSPVCAILASQGGGQVEVYKLPRVTIISTGTELVELDQPILEHQIYMSNSYAIESELRNFGLDDITRTHIVDDKVKTQELIEHALNESDILILTGGVSKGKFDFIPECLKNLGVKKHFHKIEQKPGKPMFYGTKNKKQVFALPGNPVSCLVCLRRYVTPSISKSLNIQERVVFGELQEKVKFKRAFTYFVPVHGHYSKSGKLLLTPIGSNGSGDFNSLGFSTGFIELPANKEEFLPGESYRFFNWNT